MSAIEGLKIEVPGDELIATVRGKAKEHAQKAEGYAKQAGEVKALQPGTGQTNDPVSSLEASAREHSKKAVLFGFIADHLDPTAIYRLSDADLIRIEIIERW